jgi:cyclopropane-fatty-acyl-phospholipid synthase
VPTVFFEAVLGRRLKYSCCLFEDGNTSLDVAEESMLRLTCERAEIENGMSVLELGCGWGSLTLWLAEHYPECKITALSNSASQRCFIEHRAYRRKLGNVKVITADMRDFATADAFDRVVSVEMFEHMRNYELLFDRVSNWLTPSGKAFVHVFCHRATPYLFETEGAGDWMGRHFFTGGMMPSEDLFRQFNGHLQIERQWRVSGLHYWRTCQEWLKNAERNRRQILARFQIDLPLREAKLRLERWRIFFMACAELFLYKGGNEWFVAHYLLGPVATSALNARIATSERPREP